MPATSRFRFAVLLSALFLTIVSASAAGARAIRAQERIGDLERPHAAAAARDAFSYTIEPLTPDVQMDPDPFDLHAPYFYFRLTNTGSSSDDYWLVIENNSDPVNFFGQVCIGTVCFPDSANITVAGGAVQDSVGAQLFPFADGMATADFVVRSLGDPAHEERFTVTIYAGTFAVGVDVVREGADGLRLEAATPNPARGATSIEFALPAADRVTLAVYDVAGRAVRTLAEGETPAGRHTVTWDGAAADGRPVPAGVYFVRLATSRGTLARTLTQVR